MGKRFSVDLGECRLKMDPLLVKSALTPLFFQVRPWWSTARLSRTPIRMACSGWPRTQMSTGTRVCQFSRIIQGELTDIPALLQQRFRQLVLVWPHCCPCSESDSGEIKMTASLVFRNVSEADLLHNYTCKLETDSLPRFVTISLHKNRMCVIQCLVTWSANESQKHLVLDFPHSCSSSSLLPFPGSHYHLHCVVHDFRGHRLREVQNEHRFVPEGHSWLSPQLLRYLLNNPRWICTRFLPGSN